MNKSGLTDTEHRETEAEEIQTFVNDVLERTPTLTLPLLLFIMERKLRDMQSILAP